MQPELIAVEKVIENEIKHGSTQKQIAETYALGIMSSWPTDWKKVNRMITKKWSNYGLQKIKKLAWRMINEK